ncbi:MAG: hypothetical protein OEZ19_00215 [Paracoccaceae bacterium]|nr:hypothetical protein [Paracoccaceae bacterium]
MAHTPSASGLPSFSPRASTQRRTVRASTPVNRASLPCDSPRAASSSRSVAGVHLIKPPVIVFAPLIERKQHIGHNSREVNTPAADANVHQPGGLSTRQLSGFSCFLPAPVSYRFRPPLKGEAAKNGKKANRETAKNGKKRQKTANQKRQKTAKNGKPPSKKRQKTAKNGKTCCPITSQPPQPLRFCALDIFAILPPQSASLEPSCPRRSYPERSVS